MITYSVIDLKENKTIASGLTNAQVRELLGIPNRAMVSNYANVGIKYKYRYEIRKDEEDKRNDTIKQKQTLELKREWIRNNPEKRSAIRRRYYQKHAEKEKAYQKEVYNRIKHTPEYKAKKREYNRRYRETNKDKIQKNSRDYYLANREKLLTYAKDYRARKKAEVS